MIDTTSTLESTRSSEAACWSLAIGLHALALLWNPIILRSDFHPAHDFVTVDVIDQSIPGGSVANEPKPKLSLMDTLKDMLMKPKAEEIAHVAPEPAVARVAAPMQPALQEKNMPRPIATAFQPQSQAEDLAMANSPNQINAARNLPNVPIGGPTLTTKSFGGIRAKDLPFQVGGGDAIATGGQSVIPVAVGNNSAKAALAYGGPALTDAKSHHTGIVPSGSSGAAEFNSIGAGAASTIQLSGTGGTGNAPTGAASGSSLHDRAGSGGGLVSKAMFGSGHGSGSGGGIESMPSAAQELDNQLAANAGGAGAPTAKKNKGFDIAGPLNNRPIVHKVIPQYPAWAEEQGIIGSVRLYFTVTPEGTVRTNIRVTKTTGYPQLDQLGIDALKKWQFAPVSTDDEGKGEWGIITFNFSLSS